MLYQLLARIRDGNRCQKKILGFVLVGVVGWGGVVLGGWGFGWGVLGGGGGRLSTAEQEYNPTPIINEIRSHVASWRELPNPADWGVTPATARLLNHWRHYNFEGVRPFFCQVEAVETIIWLTEVARAAKSATRNSGSTSRAPTNRPIPNCFASP